VPERLDQQESQFEAGENRRTDDDLFPDKKRFHLRTSSSVFLKGKVRASEEGRAK
jgi:hypothetical protein